MASPCHNMDDSIIEYMTKLQGKNDLIKRLYGQWKEILDKHEIVCNIRQKFDPWFQKCYNERESAKYMYSKLHEEFLKASADASKSNDFLLRQELTDVQNYTDAVWVQKAIDCVTDEKELMQRHKEAQSQSIHKKHFQKLDADITSCEKLYKETEHCLEQVEEEERAIRIVKERKDEDQQNLHSLREVMTRKQSKHDEGLLQQHSLESNIQSYTNALQKHMNKAHDLKQILNGKFDKLTSQLVQLVEQLLQEVKIWQKHYQLKYAELGSNRKIEDIDQLCADVGLILHNLHHTEVPKWQEVIGMTEADAQLYNQVSQNVAILYTEFIKGTFIVTEQEDFIVKTDKKYLPKIKVRILALEKIDVPGIKVSAYFTREEDINSCLSQVQGTQNQEFSIEKLDKVSHHLNQSTLTISRNKKSSRFEVVFDKLSFKGPFNRSSVNDKKFVHEEKYRVVFRTQVGNFQLMALSLPLVVTTGANQGCCALASVMWQCFSTDVFQIPIQNRPVLPWKDVASMLAAKISKLSEQQKLSSENIRHLKRRLLGSENHSDDQEVSLNQFCFDRMNKGENSDQQHNFSFWKWFLANYNLLDKYLKPYWEDNLIGGFLSREDVDQMFKRARVQKSGTFILRFSDNHINDSQGINSVFGILTAMVTTRVEEDGEKKCKIHSIDVAGHRILKDKNLANALKETQNKNGVMIYQHLFPGNRSREEYFDKYCKEGTVVEGYRGRRDAFIVDLEQDMKALKITTGKHRRSSTDSGIEAMSPMSDGGNKRVRGQPESYPVIKNLLTNGSSVMGSPGHFSITSQYSPISMPLSPEAMSSPATQHGMYDAMSPESVASIQSRLPTMLQAGSPGVESSHLNGLETISNSDLNALGNITNENGHVVGTSSPMNNSMNCSLAPVIVEPANPDYGICRMQNVPISNEFVAGYGGEAVVSCSSPIQPTCHQVNQIQAEISHLSRSNPDIFNAYICHLLSKFSSQELENLQTTFSSVSASPAHPAVEMDNTPNDFVGPDFMSNEDMMNVNSGSIDVNCFDDLPDDSANM